MTSTVDTPDVATVMTMTEREVRKRLIDLSVVTLSALVLGGGYLLASSVDHERVQRAASLPEASVQLAPVSAEVTTAAPVPGLRAAPPPRRRVVVVRRSRAS